MLQYHESLDTLAKQYHEQKYLLFRQLIAPDQTFRLLEILQDLPVCTVICGNPNIRFGQQDVAETHPLAHFFQERVVVDLVLAIAQLPGSVIAGAGQACMDRENTLTPTGIGQHPTAQLSSGPA
ncbi:MAG TPA: hypothetical protein VGF67_01475 [Ktedonobacteraceae bacterium]|jgi:hypothetical protein